MVIIDIVKTWFQVDLPSHLGQRDGFKSSSDFQSLLPLKRKDRSKHKIKTFNQQGCAERNMKTLEVHVTNIQIRTKNA